MANDPAETSPPQPEAIAPSQSENGWVRPAAETDAEPRWGIEGGIQFGTWPSAGRGRPRGLIRVYAPYLGFPDDRIVNFIAIEPMKANARSLSELEMSQLDNVRGLRFWSVDSIEQVEGPKLPWEPSRGVITTIPDGRGGEVEALRVVVVTEPFRAGMQAAVEVTVRKDRPREIRLRTFMQGERPDVDSCVLTATMGNFMRLRKLWLKDRVVTSHALYPDYRGSDFAPHRAFALDQLFRTPDAGVLVVAAPDEPDLTRADYDPAVRQHWRYAGKPAVQYWRVEKEHLRDALRAQVNARFTYWASKTPIPGGISFENFELIDDYREGQEFIFGISEEILTGPLEQEYPKYLAPPGDARPDDEQ